MKATCKVMTVIALSTFFFQSSESNNLKVKIIKINPKSREKTWSYAILTPGTTPKVKTFKKDTTITVNTDNNTSSLKVYTNSRGQEKAAKSGPTQTNVVKELFFDPVVITKLTDKSNVIAVDVEGNLAIRPMDEINKLIVETRKISVEKVESNRDQWRIASWSDGGEAAIDGVTIPKGKTKATQKLAIPKKGQATFYIRNTTQHSNYPPLIIQQDSAPSFSVLKLNDRGEQVN